MRTIACIAFVAVTLLAFSVFSDRMVFSPAVSTASQPSSAPGHAPQTTTDTLGPAVRADAGTAIVVEFYKALMQEEPPTLEQQDALFRNDGVHRGTIQYSLVQNGKGTDKDPLILQYFREHKDLFLTRNTDIPLKEVQISCTFDFVRSLDHMKDPKKPGYGYVMALFLNDRKAVPPDVHIRTVIFGIVEGKIAPDSIQLDGSWGNYASKAFVNEKTIKEAIERQARASASQPTSRPGQ